MEPHVRPGRFETALPVGSVVSRTLPFRMSLSPGYREWNVMPVSRETWLMSLAV